MLDGIRRWWKVIASTVWTWSGEDNAFQHAAALGFYTLFSLAPILIIAITLAGLILGEEAARGELVEQFEGLVGREAALLIQSAIRQSAIETGGFLPTLLGIAFLLVGATTVFAQMQYSLNQIWSVVAKPTRNSILVFLKTRLVSLAIVVSFGFLLLVSLLFNLALTAAIRFAEPLIPVPVELITAIDFLISLLVISVIFGLIFKVLPDVSLEWRDVRLGAIITAVLFIIGRYFISFYLTHTSTATTFGAASSLVVILLWVYYSALILYLGACFIKVYANDRGHLVAPKRTAVQVRRELVSERIGEEAKPVEEDEEGEAGRSTQGDT